MASFEAHLLNKFFAWKQLAWLLLMHDYEQLFGYGPDRLEWKSYEAAVAK